MDLDEAKSIQSQIGTLQRTTGSDRTQAIRAWCDDPANERDGQTAAERVKLSLSIFGQMGGSARRRKRASSELALPLLDRDNGTLSITRIMRDIYGRFGYAPCDDWMTSLLDLVGHPAPSGKSNFSAARSTLKKEGLIFECSGEPPFWRSHLDPEIARRQALQKEIEAAAAQAELDTQRAKESHRRLEELRAALIAEVRAALATSQSETEV